MLWRAACKVEHPGRGDRRTSIVHNLACNQMGLLALAAHLIPQLNIRQHQLPLDLEVLHIGATTHCIDQRVTAVNVGFIVRE
jgi:hypothetical protein